MCESKNKMIFMMVCFIDWNTDIIMGKVLECGYKNLKGKLKCH